MLLQFLAGGYGVKRRGEKTRSDLCSDQISPKLKDLYMTLSIPKRERDWVQKWGKCVVFDADLDETQ